MSWSRRPRYAILASLILTAGCSETSPTEAEALTGVPIDKSPTGGAADSRMRVLVDASKDGGVWWFPQADSFDPGEGHQGKALADHLRRLGYEVTELGRDELAELVGIGFVGASAIEPIVTFADHPITDDVDGLPYIAGAYAVSSGTTGVEFLGWLADGQPVMGVVTGLPSRVFFLGDTNVLEGVPQPLVENLIAWGF